MWISYRWLQRHIDLSGLDAQQIGEDLTMSTAEVEKVSDFGAYLEDVKVGFVKDRQPHPDADKLSVCQVDVGEAEPLQIVCGAPNVAAGQKVPVAVVGAVLPGDFKIKKSKIRGVASQGMICARCELFEDVPEDRAAGIWELPEALQVGQSLGEALEITDWVFEIDNKSITHRPDLWGHRGIAAELSAIYQRPLEPLDVGLPSLGGGAGYPVRIEDAACRRYLGLVIEGARPEMSPQWLQNLLLSVKQRPIDLLVDLSNFVLLDLGQPNHTFDADALEGAPVVVRKASSGESISTLDGELRALTDDDLLICADRKPVALAGIMGGEGSKVEAGTRRLLLEVASFEATTVRRTSSRLGLRTDSSARFEKSLTPTLPAEAAGHFARLLQAEQPEVSFPCALTDVGDWQDPACTLSLRPQRVRSALGEALTDAIQIDILQRLGFGVQAADGVLQVTVPSARASKDIGIEQDLVEEVGRIYRYGNIPEQALVVEVRPPHPSRRRALVRKLQDRLAGVGHFRETLGYSFVSDDMLGKLGRLDVPHVQVSNPVDSQQSRIRRDLVPSLLTGLETNLRHTADVRVFEIGKSYLPGAAEDGVQPRELHRLALVMARPKARDTEAFDADSLSGLRGVVEDLFFAVEVQLPDWQAVEGDAPDWAHPVKCLRLRAGGGDEDLAVVAALEPGLARELGLAGDLQGDVACAEISLDALLAAPAGERRFQPLPRFPGVKLDVAVEAASDLRAADITKAIRQAGKKQVAAVSLFDVYAGDRIEAGKKSLAFHVTLQSPDRTLSDKDQGKFLKRLDGALERVGARLRA